MLWIFYWIMFNDVNFVIKICSMYGSKLNLILFNGKQGLASIFISKRNRENFAMHFHTAGGCKLLFFFCFPSIHKWIFSIFEVKIVYNSSNFDCILVLHFVFFVVSNITRGVIQVDFTWDQGLLRRGWISISSLLG